MNLGTSDGPSAERPTMADVGRQAGVSITTVSLVLSGQHSRISEATKARVLKAVEDLNYRPNKAAQGLRLGQTRTIGFVTDEILTQPFSGNIAAGLSAVAWEQQSLLLTVNATMNTGRLRAAVEDLIDRQVDALVFAAMGSREVDFPETPPNLPVLLINAYDRRGRIPSIMPNEEEGGRSAIEHALDLGHERFVFLAGRENAWATKMRVRGYRDGLEIGGLRPADNPIFYGDYRIGSGYDLAVRAMQRRPRPTTLLCGNDQMAIGAYIALARMGVRIPEQVSIVGYDDEPIAADLSPSLTTVRIPFYEMGRVAATHALAGTVSEIGQMLMSCPIVPRASTNRPLGQ